MGAVRITQIDGKLPNLALMKLAAFHRAVGDEVYFSRSANRDMFEPRYDKVYGSAIFKFSAPKIDRFVSQFPHAVIGGTGTTEAIDVESLIGPATALDYSIYPKFSASIGFTQRGCRLKCKFCVVPQKEGKPKEENTIAEIWRGAGHPKHIHLLDNDFFGGPKWKDRIEEIRDGQFKVSFTQGINVRAMNTEVASAIASIEYRDNKFSKRRLYTAWDNLKDEKVFFRGLDMLAGAGVPERHVMAYMLVGFDPKEDWDRIFCRFNKMVDRGVLPYPMVFDQSRKDLKRFQRWAVTGLYRAVPFDQYDASIKKTRSHLVSVQEPLL